MLKGDYIVAVILFVSFIFGFFLGRKTENRGMLWCAATLLTIFGSAILTCIFFCTGREAGDILTKLAEVVVSVGLGAAVPAITLVIAEQHYGDTKTSYW